MSLEWWTIAQATAHAKCGKKSIYLAVSQGKLQAARLGGRRELRFLESWIDTWLLASSRPVIVNASLVGEGLPNRVESAGGLKV